MPVDLVVKNASKICFVFLASIPIPESSTVIETPSVSSFEAIVKMREVSAVVLMASAAFLIKLSSTSLS